MEKYKIRRGLTKNKYFVFLCGQSTKRLPAFYTLKSEKGDKDSKQNRRILALARRPARVHPQTAADAVLSDARRNCPAGVVGECYRKAETADRCRVCRTGISPGLIFTACGRRTYPLLYQSTM